MKLTDVYSAKAIALTYTESASNKIPYLGAGLFPAKKKMGLDLKWIKTSKGLPVTLKASAFDTVSTIRSREGIKIENTEMAFFKESMLVKEADRQEILRVQESSDPYAQDVLKEVISEREKQASALKEKELFDQTPNPNGGGGTETKTDAEKFAESYGKRIAESNKVTSDVMSHYI